MIRLIIKGNASEARAALDARGLLTTSMLNANEHGCTVTTVHPTDLDVVTAWFTQPVRVAKGEGFPIGSLLHYQIEG